MIKLPTHDLVTMVRNVADFAPSARTHKELALVRLACTGDALQVSTYGITHAATATWRPPAAPAGGFDEPWEVLLRNAQVKDLVRVFELKGGNDQIPVTLYVSGGTLHASRPGDDVTGVDARQQPYIGWIESNPPRADVEFDDLGERVNRLPELTWAVAVGLGQVCKRTGLTPRITPHVKGVNTCVGDGLVVSSRWPSNSAEREADQRAIVDAAVNSL